MKRHIRKLAQLAIVFSFLFLGTNANANAVEKLSGAGTVQSKDMQPLQVTFLIYSGRPNPTMVVRDPGDLKKIDALFAGARAAATAPQKQSADSYPVLGYNGIRVEPLTAAKTGAMQENAQELVINRGITRIKPATSAQSGRLAAGQQEEQVSYDTEKTLETYFLELARDQRALSPDEAHMIEQSIAR